MKKRVELDSSAQLSSLPVKSVIQSFITGVKICDFLLPLLTRKLRTWAIFVALGMT